VHVSDVVHVERDEVGYARQLRGVTVDTTGRRTLEEQLRQSQKMEAIGRLAAGVAHDFNNLLSVIIGRTEMLRARHAALGTPLDLIASTAQKAAALTRQLLAFGRQQVLEARVLDFGAVVRGLAPMLRRVVREDIELLIEISGAGHVEADPVQIEQVVLNLVVNACDAMPSGGRLTIEVDEVELGLRPDGWRVGAPAGRYVSLRVSDTGIGMDETTLANIFEPFFTTKDVGKGTGLGLATVYGIVTQSNGDIRVESTPGSGTSFTIYLPRVDAPLAPKAPAPTRERDVAGTETIMLVEDEPDVRALMRDVLAELGYQVLVAGSSEDALRLADRITDPVDLLITDVVMSGMNGVELAERFTMKRPATKVLYMTGYSHEAVAGLGALRGSSLLQKPFRPNDLALRVREVLDAVRV
jgi:nitrogen-specific signal transduction histidine kinase